MAQAIAAVLLPLLLAGCVSAPVPPPVLVPPALVGDCGAGGLAALVGRPVADLPASGPWKTLRVIRPGMMVTMEYSATRLDVAVDGSGLILKLSCG